MRPWRYRFRMQAASNTVHGVKNNILSDRAWGTLNSRSLRTNYKRN